MTNMLTPMKLDERSSEESAYSYQVRWSDEDEMHVGRVAEFPSLAAHGDTPHAARAEIMALVRSVLADLRASDEHVPPASNVAA